MSTNEEYLDSLLRDFEKSISEHTEGETEEIQSSVLEEEIPEEVTAQSEEAIDNFFSEMEEEQAYSDFDGAESLDENIESEETKLMYEETLEDEQSTSEESGYEEPVYEEPEYEEATYEETEELQSQELVDTDSEETLEVSLEDIKNMSVDENEFFEDGTQNYDELDPLFIDSMKNEWESGLNVEEFGFTEDDFLLEDEELKFDFEEESLDELEKTIDILADDYLDEQLSVPSEETESLSESSEETESLSESSEETEPLSAPLEEEERESDDISENIEQLTDAENTSEVQEETTDNQDIADLFSLLDSAEGANQTEEEDSTPKSDLNIDFANMFSEQEPSTDVEGLGLEYDEGDESAEIAAMISGEERKERNKSLFQRLIQEKEEPEIDEELEKKKEEKAAKKAEKAEAKAAKKQQQEEAKKAKQEAKRVKKEAEKAEPKEPFAVKSFMVIALFGATLAVCILVLSSVLSYHPYIANARTYFDAREYKKAYEQLEGIEIKEKDFDFYAQVRTMEKISSKVSAYERMWAIDKKAEALTSLIEGIALYDEKLEYAESIGLKTEYQLVLDEMIAILQDNFQISLDEARTMTAEIGTEEYTIWIQSHI